MEINTSVDNSIAFESKKAEAVDRSDEELKNQSSTFLELLKQPEKSEDISYKTTITDANSITTTFVDPTNGKMVAVSLNNEVVSKLEEYFGKSDVYKSDDGTITLDNKAESYVSAWFADIAYKREFISADANNDGKLSQEEYNQTKNTFSADVKVTVTKADNIKVDVEESVGTSYINPKEDDKYTSLYRSSHRAKSLDDELNMTLSIDKNFDSKIDLAEAYSTNENVSKDELLLAHVNSLNIEDVVRSKANTSNQADNIDLSVSFSDILSLLISLLLNSDEEKVKEALKKLKENDGDISALDLMEKQIIEEVLKLKPDANGKYNLEDISKAIELFDSYEIKGKNLENEKKVDTNIDKTSK